MTTAPVPDRLRPAITWRDLLMAVTEELRHAPAAALDEPVVVQLPGRTTTLQSVTYDAEEESAEAGAGRLVLDPWLV